MKNLVLFTILTLISFSSFARECVSVNLEAEQEKLDSNSELSDSEKQALVLMTRNTKLVQILTCVGLNHALTSEDADFAVAEIERTRDGSIAKLRSQEAQYLKNLSEATQPSGRQLWMRLVHLTQDKIQSENQRAIRLIEQIRAAE